MRKEFIITDAGECLNLGTGGSSLLIALSLGEKNVGGAEQKRLKSWLVVMNVQLCTL